MKRLIERPKDSHKHKKYKTNVIPPVTKYLPLNNCSNFGNTNELITFQSGYEFNNSDRANDTPKIISRNCSPIRCHIRKADSSSKITSVRVDQYNVQNESSHIQKSNTSYGPPATILLENNASFDKETSFEIVGYNQTIKPKPFIGANSYFSKFKCDTKKNSEPNNTNFNFLIALFTSFEDEFLLANIFNYFDNFTLISLFNVFLHISDIVYNQNAQSSSSNSYALVNSSSVTLSKLKGKMVNLIAKSIDSNNQSSQNLVEIYKGYFYHICLTTFQNNFYEISKFVNSIPTIKLSTSKFEPNSMTTERQIKLQYTKNHVELSKQCVSLLEQCIQITQESSLKLLSLFGICIKCQKNPIVPIFLVNDPYYFCNLKCKLYNTVERHVNNPGDEGANINNTIINKFPFPPFLPIQTEATSSIKIEKRNVNGLNCIRKMEFMDCSECSIPYIIRSNYSSSHYCEDCLIDSYNNQITKRTISRTLEDFRQEEAFHSIILIDTFKVMFKKWQMDNIFMMKKGTSTNHWKKCNNFKSLFYESLNKVTERSDDNTIYNNLFYSFVSMEDVVSKYYFIPRMQYMIGYLACKVMAKILYFGNYLYSATGKQEYKLDNFNENLISHSLFFKICNNFKLTADNLTFIIRSMKYLSTCKHVVNSIIHSIKNPMKPNHVIQDYETLHKKPSSSLLIRTNNLIRFAALNRDHVAMHIFHNADNIIKNKTKYKNVIMEMYKNVNFEYNVSTFSMEKVKVPVWSILFNMLPEMAKKHEILVKINMHIDSLIK